MMTARFDFDTLTNYLRVLMTYILPLIIHRGVILCGLWIVPDILYGMYANVDGKWMSWNHAVSWSGLHSLISVPTPRSRARVLCSFPIFPGLTRVPLP